MICAGRRAVGVEEELDEQPLDRRRVVADLVIARRLARRRMLEPVERALAGQRRTVRPSRLELAGQDRHRRVVPQPVVVEHILIPQRQAEHPLADQRRDLVLDPLLRAPIAEAAGEPLDEPDRLVRRPPAAARRHPRSRHRRRTPPPHGDLRPLQSRTAARYTLSASGSSSASP